MELKWRPRHKTIDLWTLDLSIKKPEMHTGEKTASTASGAGHTGRRHVEECNRLICTPCTQLASKWVKGLNIKPDTLNLTEDKAGNSPELIGTAHEFRNRTQTAQALRSAINKWDLRKPTSFCKAKDTIHWTEWQPTEPENNFTNSTSDRGLISKYIENSKN